MIALFPNELIFEIFAYLNKCKDLSSCLLVCSHWSQLISYVIQINHHNHKLLRWWKIHQQIKKFQLQKSLQRHSEITTFEFMYECGFALELFCGKNNLLVTCITIFHHSCQLFDIPFSTQPLIQTIHLDDLDTFCIHLRDPGQLKIKISQNKAPTCELEVRWSPLCRCFSAKPMQLSNNLSYYKFYNEFVFFVDALWSNVINLNVYDTKKQTGVTISRFTSTKEGAFDVKVSQNYLFFPAEKCVAFFCEAEFSFNYFKIENQPSKFDHVCFLSTNDHGLLFWFDQLCYVGNVGNVKNRSIDLVRYDNFDQLKPQHITQCENNNEILAISNPFAIRLF